MFFSIIIPVYNVEKYLNECVDSVLSQTFSDFELILVDDGSKDKSPSICDAYAEKDSRVKVIHKENGGAANARNAGLKQAAGEYIIFIDSDDYVSKNYFLQAVNDKCLSKPDVVLYKFQKYKEDEKRYEGFSFDFPKNLPDQRPSTIINALVASDAFYCSPWSKCVKASLLKDNGIQFESGRFGEDQEWYYHVVTIAKSYEMIDEPFIVYRLWGGSTSNAKNIKILSDSLYVLEKWTAFVRDSSFDEEMKTALNGSLAKLFCNTLIAYSRYPGNEKKVQVKRFKELSYLLKYTQNKRTRITAKIYRLCGFNGTIFAISVLNKIKK